MTLIATDKEWLEKSVENEDIRFYPYSDLTDQVYVGHGAFGVVFKAIVATSGITVAYKIINHWNEDEFFKCLVKEICEYAQTIVNVCECNLSYFAVCLN